jgi:FkbM family methyltransferase
MRKIFIDAGANSGDTIDVFRNNKMFRVYDPNEFDIYAIEINPKHKLPEKYKDDDKVIVMEKAVWVEEGEIDFKSTGDDNAHRDQGSSIIPDKKDVRYKYDVIRKTPCFDFAQWVIDTFNKDDYILLKMDIEGAEFKVLEHMMEMNMFDYFNGICCEFHDVGRAFDKPVRHEIWKIII